MSKMGKAFGLVGLSVALLATCHQSILTAPPGSEIVGLIANPNFIPANGGVSVITAVVYDGTGQPVPDGTVVQFFTDLGRVDPQGKTNDGVAQVNLRADGRSGEASVQAVIGGGAAPAPSASPTSSAAATSGASPAALGANSRVNSGATVLRVASVADVVNPVKVKIGTQLPERIFLSADPRNIAFDAPRFSTLTATVFDERGNPVANIPVVFRILPRSDPDFTESLESGGRPVFTDTNGQAKDRLWTAVERGGRSQQVDVQALVAGADLITSETVTVGINF